MHVGRALRLLRWQRGMGIPELARRLGTSHSTVWRIETGGAVPDRLRSVITEWIGACNEHLSLEWGPVRQLPDGVRKLLRRAVDEAMPCRGDADRAYVSVCDALSRHVETRGDGK